MLWRLLGPSLLQPQHGAGTIAAAASQIKNITTYNQGFGPMKTFIQERLMSIILAITNGKVYAPPLELMLHYYEPEMREVLISMDVLKKTHLQTKDPRFLDTYKAMRDGFAFDKQRIAVVRK